MQFAIYNLQCNLPLLDVCLRTRIVIFARVLSTKSRLNTPLIYVNLGEIISAGENHDRQQSTMYKKRNF